MRQPSRINFTRLAEKLRQAMRAEDFLVIDIPLPRPLTSTSFVVWMWRTGGTEPGYWGA